MLHISTVPFCTPSTTPKAGISSPAACVEIWNLPPVMSLTFLANTSQTPNSVSSDFGKLEARRQRMLGLGVHDGGCGTRGQHTGQAGATHEGTTFH